MENIVRKTLSRIMSETNKKLIEVPVTPLRNKVLFADYKGNSFSKEDPVWMEDFNKMNDGQKYPFSDIIKTQEEILCKKLFIERDKALEKLVCERLCKLGYEFRNDELFHLFVKNRITKVGFEEDRDTEYLYLDFVSELEKGILLVTFSNKIEYDYDIFSGKITMSIG